MCGIELNPLCKVCCYWLHGQWSGVRGSLTRVAEGFVCRGGGRQATDEFHFEDVELECVAYLGHMLNDTGGWNKL